MAQTWACFAPTMDPFGVLISLATFWSQDLLINQPRYGTLRYVPLFSLFFPLLSLSLSLSSLVLCVYMVCGMKQAEIALGSLMGHGASIASLQYDPTTHLVVTASLDKTIKVTFHSSSATMCVRLWFVSNSKLLIFYRYGT